MKFTYSIIEHKDLTPNYIFMICSFKEKEWSYGMESQQRWLNDNLSQNDKHVIVLHNKNIVAYCNIVLREMQYNNNVLHFFGIGNVLVDKKYRNQGVGLQLMNYVNNLCFSNGFSAFLFCKKNTVPFYKKSGWMVVDCRDVIINNSSFADYLMYLGSITFKKTDTLVFNVSF